MPGAQRGGIDASVQAFFGTSGFSYPEWRGVFYPERLDAAEMLGFYATRLPTVELNNSFYRMPRPAQVESWVRAVPAEFRFALKAPRRITHIKKLRDVDDTLAALEGASKHFGESLGPTLFQLPPFLQKDVGLLREFVGTLPNGCLAAFEFRHGSWFAEETYRVLADCGASLCTGDVDDSAKSPPFVRTAPFCYLRLRRSSYTETDLDTWAARLEAGGFDTAFGYFKHEELGPELARRMCARFGSS